MFGKKQEYLFLILVEVLTLTSVRYFTFVTSQGVDRKRTETKTRGTT